MSPASGGCQTCKTRRIKCDETKPVCQRCTKSRRICLEARAARHACFSIHVENCYADGTIKRPRGPRSSLTLLPPQCNLQERALAYYLQCHIYTLTEVPHVSESLSKCVCAWRASGKSCSMVDLAVSSMALAVYARTQQHPQAIIEASLTYQRLLGVAQERIVSGETISVDEQNLDAFLLAILLMGRYEGVMHRSNDIKSSGSFKSFQSWSHHDGAMAILKVWKGNPNRAPATKIIQQTRRGLIRSSLLRNLPLPQWILDGVCFGEDAKGYDNIFTRAVNLHHAMLSLQENDEDHTAQAADLVLELRKLEEALQDWVARFPSSWSYQRHTLTIVGPWPRKHFFSPVVLSYTELGYGVVWSQYFATSILINSVRWRVLKFSPLKRLVGSLYEQQQLECISQLSAMADELASTIPFVLGRIKVLDDSDSSSRQPSIKLNMKEEIKPHLASLAVWPLTIASSLEGINIRQQLWFRCELATLGRTLGASVLECAETSEWATL